MSKSETPKTDQQVFSMGIPPFHHDHVIAVTADFARFLERSLSLSNRKLELAVGALKLQRDALCIVRDQQRCNVSEADLTKGITLIDDALARIAAVGT